MNRPIATRTLATLLLVLAGAAPGFALAAMAETPCVPDGGSSEYEFDRPDLPEANREWTHNGTGNPQASDEDAFSDDDMGDADSGSDPNTASVTVSNSDGDLSGPNDETVNGGADGDCAEVYVTWSYRVLHTISLGLGQKVSYKPAGVGGATMLSVGWTFSWYTYGTVESENKEVCPC